MEGRVMARDEMTGRVQRLVEQIRDWRAVDVRVDREERVVANIALTGLESRNGYRYSEAALREALPLYEDKPVFLDHAVNAGRPYDRSTRDLVGAVVNPRFDNERVRGDVRVLDTEAGRTFLALAEGANPAVGMSQVVLAERSADRAVVEKIHEVVSVDAVVFPATVNLRESVDGEDVAKPQATVEDVNAIERLQEELRGVREERDRLRERVEELQSERRRREVLAEVESLVHGAQLPACLVTDILREQLIAAPDDAARRALIAERQRVWREMERVVPASRERGGVRDGLPDEVIVAAVRGARRPGVLSERR